MRLDVPAPAAMAPLQEQLRWVCHQKLAFGDARSAVRFDAIDLADEIGLAVNLTRFDPLHSRQLFVHRAAYLLAGDTFISAAAYLPLVASTCDYSESTLEIPYAGFTRYRIEGKDWFNRAGLQALYLPGQAFDVETNHFNGLLLNLKPFRLAQTIGLLSRGAVPLELAERWVQQPLVINLRDPRILHLQRHLEAAFEHLAKANGPTIGAPFSAAALAVEQLTYSTSARMLLITMESERQGLI
jgi:hypothetical protein